MIYDHRGRISTVGFYRGLQKITGAPFLTRVNSWRSDLVSTSLYLDKTSILIILNKYLRDTSNSFSFLELHLESTNRMYGSPQTTVNDFTPSDTLLSTISPDPSTFSLAKTTEPVSFKFRFSLQFTRRQLRQRVPSHKISSQTSLTSTSSFLTRALVRDPHQPPLTWSLLPTHSSLVPRTR